MNFFIDNTYNIGLLVLALLSGGTLLFSALQLRGEKVSVLQATQKINAGKTILVDVRDAAVFATGHVPDAKNIPLKELANRVGELEKFKSKSVIVVCDTGVQSSRAVTQLKNAGFGEVFSLDGGLAAWQAQGLPTAK